LKVLQESELPLTNTGKVKKNEMQALFDPVVQARA
jgi:hypothetical protein